MRQFILGLAIVISIAALAGAYDDGYSFNYNVNSIDKLVTADSPLGFGMVIPGQDYARNVTIRWAVPPEALDGIISNNVSVYVTIAPAGNYSWIYFVHDGKEYKSLSIVLNCLPEKNSCANSSHLSEVIETRLHAPINAQYPHSDNFTIKATLYDQTKPDEPFLSYDTVMQKAKTILSIAVPQAAEQINQFVKQAKEEADRGNYTNADKLLEEAAKIPKQIGIQTATTTTTESGQSVPGAAIVQNITGMLGAANAPVVLGLLGLIVIDFWAYFNMRSKRGMYKKY